MSLLTKRLIDGQKYRELNSQLKCIELKIASGNSDPLFTKQKSHKTTTTTIPFANRADNSELE